MKEPIDNGARTIELNEGFCYVITNENKTRFVGFSKSYGEYVWMDDIQDASQFTGEGEAENFLGAFPGFLDDGRVARREVKTIYTLTATK